MLGFYAIDPDRIEDVREEGLPESAGPYRVETRLETARSRWPDRFPLVLDLLEIEQTDSPPGDPNRTDGISDPTALIRSAGAHVVLNLDPPRPPEGVAAAGGYVMRGSTDAPDLLLIRRRGVWDLPKGTVEADESSIETARREVCEEVGLDEVHVLDDLDRTLHGYYRDDRFWVKTTRWYAMTAEAGVLRPEREEGIDRVAWIGWADVTDRLGYRTLRYHFDRWQMEARKSLEKIS